MFTVHSNPYPRSTGVQPGAMDDTPEFVSVSAALRRLLQQADITAARLRVATLEGEAGTGKFLLAETIRQRSGMSGQILLRRDASEWLATDTDISSLTGTLYLDRVDRLPPSGQNLLLNFLKSLQNFDFSPNAKRFVLLASAHIPLRQLAAQGHFLPDLAFRLTAVRFALPPLREHREDIGPITQALIDRICRRYQQPTTVLGTGCLPRLLQHNWPGNVRELASVLESAILESTGNIIRPADIFLSYALPAVPATPPSQQLPADISLDAAILRHIHLVLGHNQGNKLRSARQLRISRSTLYRILDGKHSLLA